eukprot:scaffold24532_cov157-Cylindrotheca_fusiformis.AAC.2
MGKLNRKIQNVSHRTLHALTVAVLLGYMLLHHRILEAQIRTSDNHSDGPSSCHSMSLQSNHTSSRASSTISLSKKKIIQWLPSCNASDVPFWKDCAPTNRHSVDVVLTVYRRRNVRLQLEMIANQTRLPQTVFIYQSEQFYSVLPILEEFHQDYPNFTVPIHLVQAPIDTAGYHGRFYTAYMLSKARYISVWDDDLTVGAGWLERVTKFMYSQNDTVIVSSGGRMIDRIADPNSTTMTRKGKEKDPTTSFSMLRQRRGEVDFCVHNYNLRRELLHYWFAASPVHTYYTGEDMQLAFALQPYGIRSYKLGGRPHQNDYADGSVGLGSNQRRTASYKKKRPEPRQWLVCQLILEGFQTKQCTNCNMETAQRCVDYFKSKGVRS